MTFVSRKCSTKWIKTYTYSFCVVAAMIVALFAIMDKSFLWKADGYQQHFTSVYYFGQYIRSFLTTGQLPMIDFNIGEGFDILTSMGYYGFGDPLNIIFCFATDATAEYFYAASILLKLFLCGLTFGLFARKLSRNDNAIAIGCLVYTFSGYLVYFSFQAPTFIAGAMYLPLVLYAMEDAFTKKKYFMLSFFVGLMWLSNFYMAVLTTMLAFVYAVIRICIFFNNKEIKNYVAIVGAYLLGILVSSAILFPMIYAFLSSGRSSVTTGYQDSMLFYPISSYLMMLRDMAAPFYCSSYWSSPYNIHLSYLPIVVPSLFLFIRHKTHRKTRESFLKIALAVSSVFAIIPFFGKVFNGFAYVTHRWAYGLSLVVSLIVVWAVPRLKKASRGVKIATAAFLALEILLYAITSEIAATVIVAVLYVGMVAVMYTKKKTPRKLNKYCVLCASAFVFCTLVFTGYIGSFANENAFDEIKSEYPMAVEESEEFYRVGEPFSGNNHSSILGYKGLTSYFSISPGAIGDFQTSLALNTTRMTFWVYGLDDRAILNSLSSAKYYTAPTGETSSIPYGFVFDRSTKTVDVYKNEYFLPVGYMYDSTLLVDDFQKLNPADKQLALLNYAVVSEHEHVAKQEEFHGAAVVLDHTSENTEDGEKIKFVAPEDHEIYIVINNATVKNSVLSLIEIRIVDFSKYAFVRGPENHCYFEMPETSINIGHGYNGIVECEIIKGIDAVEYDDITVFALPLSEFREGVEQRQKDVLTNVKYSKVGSGERQNYISGEIDVEREGVLQLAIPFSKGWSVYIDGEKADAFASGLKYIGVNIGEGTHTVEAEYRTPLILPGVVMTVLSCFALLALFVVEYKDLVLKTKRSSLIRFLLAGATTTLCDYAIYMLLSSFAPIGISKVISMAIACVLSYFINKYWSFKSTGSVTLGQTAKFLGSQVVNIGLNTATNYLMFMTLQSKTLAFIVATAISMCVNYLLQKYWVFRRREEK